MSTEDSLDALGKSIFNKWIGLADNKNLKKRYKDWITKTTTEGLNYEETVLSVTLFMVGKIQIREKSADVETREPKAIVPMSSVNSKGPFWEFERPVEFENWKGKPFVKFFSSVKPYKCPQCSGKGFNPCQCEAGWILCRTCNGNSTIKCVHCSGKGQKSDKVEITDGLSGKKRVTELVYQCSNCYGASVRPCSNCGGHGKTGHSRCNFTGKLTCSNCKGTGQLVDILEEPVPIKSAKIDEYITGLKSEVENNQVINILSGGKHNLGKFDHPRADLALKDLATVLKNPTKDHEKFVKDVNKLTSNILKQKNEEIIEPIVIYYGYKLNCKSTKGHSFEIWSFGDPSKYDIVEVGFA